MSVLLPCLLFLNGKSGGVHERTGLMLETAPPSHPLYPEPPLRGRYALRAELYATHLPRKFAEVEEGQVVVVEADGRLVGEYWDAGKEQVASRDCRWSWVPWTEAMEVSCRPWALSLRRWNG